MALRIFTVTIYTKIGLPEYDTGDQMLLQLGFGTGVWTQAYSTNFHTSLSDPEILGLRHKGSVRKWKKRTVMKQNTDISENIFIHIKVHVP